MYVTVFTPTYNRGYVIENLYYSLQRQTFRDFEWIVIDDGSTDDTEEKFQKILSEQKDFDIVYEKVENGGKHRAINRGVQIARGKLFFIVDSDDYLTDNALEKIVEIEKTIRIEDKFAGVCGRRGYSVTQGIGSTFIGDLLDITMLERPKYGISGDKAEVFYTEILKRYPFPEFEGEKFVTECVVWDKIAHDGFRLRFFNDIIYICDYLPDGLTANSARMYNESPKGYGLYIYQSGLYRKTFGVEKWEQYMKYYYQFRERMKFKEIAGNLHISPFILWMRLTGMKIFYKLYDR